MTQGRLIIVGLPGRTSRNHPDQRAPLWIVRPRLPCFDHHQQPPHSARVLSPFADTTHKNVGVRSRKWTSPNFLVF